MSSPKLTRLPVGFVMVTVKSSTANEDFFSMDDGADRTSLYMNSFVCWMQLSNSFIFFPP